MGVINSQIKKLTKRILALGGLEISRISHPNLNSIILAFGEYQISRISDSKKNSQHDAFKIQKSLIKDVEDNLIIFDVGAYVGQMTKKYNQLFPNSTIYCFEPFPDSFIQLAQNTQPFRNIIPVNRAVGEFSGKSKIHSNAFSPTNSILATDERGDSIWGKGLMDTEEVVDIELITIDDFVNQNNIEKIDILKLDVQGAEHKVIEGAKNTLQNRLVELIYTEIMTLPSYKGQMPFDELISFIRSFGYELFNLYNYSLTDDGQLRQVDAIFIKSENSNNAR